MTVKSLLVKIGADVSEFDRATKDIDSKTKALGASLRKVGAGLTAVGAVITGTIGLMVKSYIQAGASLMEMSERTGMSTTALSELKYAVSLCGADIHELEIGIKKMSSSLFDAAVAGDQVPNAFTRIGLSTQDLIKLSPEQQFDKIARALAAIESPTIRAATAVDIFGRSGTKLLPLFSEGPAGMDAMRQKAHDLGVVFDLETAAKAHALENAIITLKASFTGIGNVVAGTLGPAITGLVEKITGVVMKVKEWTTTHPGLSSAIFKVATAMGLLMTAIGPVLIVLPTLMASLKMLGLAQMASLGPIALVTAALAGLAVGYLTVEDAQNRARRAAERYDEVANAFRDRLREVAYAAGLMSVDFDALTKKYGENYVAMGMAIKKGKEGVALQTALAAVGREHKAVIDAQRQALIDKANAEMAAIKKQELGIKSTAELTDELKNAQKALAAMLVAGNEAPGVIEAMQKKVDDLKTSLQGATPTFAQWTAGFLKMRAIFIEPISLTKITPITEDLLPKPSPAHQAALEAQFQWLFGREIEAAERAATMGQMWESAMGQMISSTMMFGDATGSIFGNIWKIFGQFVKSIIVGLELMALKEIWEAHVTIAAEQAKAQARGMSSAAGLPWPFNLIAMAAAFAVVNTLFSKILKFKEGGVVTGPTLALVGEAGPEMVIPLNKLGAFAERDRRPVEVAAMSVNLYAPMIQTTGLSRSEIDRAAADLFEAVEGQARRWGFSMKKPR